MVILKTKFDPYKFIIFQNETYEEIFTVSGGSSCSDSDGEPEVENTRTGSASSANPGAYPHIDGRSTCPPGILKNQDKHEILVDKTLPRSKSCDSIDLIYNSPETDKVKKGRLKEHRRRERRAVTLNNLDSKQLLLILDLQKRYQEETRLLKSQGNLNLIDPSSALPAGDIALQRRAFTPQPYRKLNPNTIPRSHTPQPRNVYGGNIRMGELSQDLQECLKKDNEISAKDDPTHVKTGVSPGSGALVTNEGYLYMAPKPKTRPSAQKFFLPPQPIQRCRSTSPLSGPRQRKASPLERLPPQPISRPLDSLKQLPPAPIQRDGTRDGSAFQLVGHPMGPMFNKGSVSHDVIYRTPGEVFCENAIRENFKLYSSPFILQSTKQRRVDPVSGTMFPPAYSGPPSYTDFLSRTDSAQESGSEHIYETYENMNEIKPTSKAFSPKRSTKKATGNSVQTTESEDDVFLPVKLSAGGALSPTTHPYIPGLTDSSRRRKPKKRSGKQKQLANEMPQTNHMRPCHPMKQDSRDSTDQPPDSEEGDNIYAVSAKAKTKQGQSRGSDSATESERGVPKRGVPKMGVFEKDSCQVDSSMCSLPCNGPSVQTTNGKLNQAFTAQNGLDVNDKTLCSVTLNKTRGYSERPSESSCCTYEDVEESSVGVSSQTSLISSSDEITREFNSAIDEIHPGLGDPRVLETMI